MATGYSGLYRDGSRKMMPFFQAKGIAPAAGYSSNAIDLAHFASWQFRLMNKADKEILRPSTLKEMQRVQWMDPNWKLTWGLGFIIWQEDGVTYLGHDGSCPGYRTGLTLCPKTKIGVSCMINAQGTDPDKYIGAVYKILNKAKEEEVDTSASKTDLNAYAGNYDVYAWGSENVVLPWNGKLLVFSVPSDDPEKYMDLFKYVSNDTFRRVRKDDGSLDDELRFERDANGKVVRIVIDDNFFNKIK